MMLRQHALHHVQKMQLRHYCVPCASGFKADGRGIHIQFHHQIPSNSNGTRHTVHCIILERCGSPYLGIQWFHMEYEPRSIRAEDVSTAPTSHWHWPIKEKESADHNNAYHVLAGLFGMVYKYNMHGGEGAAEKWQTTASEFAAGPPIPG